MLDEAMLHFQDELTPGERIIWSGKPQQGLLLRSSDIFFIPFSLLWGGGAFFWGYTVITDYGPSLLSLFGIPVMLLGIYVIVGRFFVDAALRGKTYYALTNERAIIVSGFLNRNVQSINLKTLTEVNNSTRRNGKGTITFGPSHLMSWFYGGGGLPFGARYQTPAFEMIEDVQSVYLQIKTSMREAFLNRLRNRLARP
jgi:hypothetical protein